MHVRLPKSKDWRSSTAVGWIDDPVEAYSDLGQGLYDEGILSSGRAPVTPAAAAAAALPRPLLDYNSCGTFARPPSIQPIDHYAPTELLDCSTLASTLASILASIHPIILLRALM